MCACVLVIAVLIVAAVVRTGLLAAPGHNRAATVHCHSLERLKRMKKVNEKQTLCGCIGCCCCLCELF